MAVERKIKDMVQFLYVSLDAMVVVAPDKISMKQWERGRFFPLSSPLGVYISVPFCKAKCTFCNFASGAFGAERLQGYVDRLCEEIRGAASAADAIGGCAVAVGGYDLLRRRYA